MAPISAVYTYRTACENRRIDGSIQHTYCMTKFTMSHDTVIEKKDMISRIESFIRENFINVAYDLKFDTEFIGYTEILSSDKLVFKFDICKVSYEKYVNLTFN
jgi:hypothetical protein